MMKSLPSLFLVCGILLLTTIPVVHSLVMAVDLGNEFMKVSTR